MTIFFLSRESLSMLSFILKPSTACFSLKPGCHSVPPKDAMVFCILVEMANKGPLNWHFNCTLTNKDCLKTKSKTVPLVIFKGQIMVTHTFNPSSHTSCHWNQVMHSFNPSPKEEYKTRGDSSQTRSHSEIPRDRIAILVWGRGKSQWLADLLFRSSGWTPIPGPKFLLIMLQ